MMCDNLQCFVMFCNKQCENMQLKSAEMHQSSCRQCREMQNKMRMNINAEAKLNTELGEN
jgi:hypothetical protein